MNDLTGVVIIKNKLGLELYRQRFTNKKGMKHKISKFKKKHQKELSEGHYYLSVIFD